MQINAAFECGNIDVIEIGEGKARLNLRSDPVQDFKQWFYFSVETSGIAADLVIENASLALIPNGWPDYRAFASTDRKNWRRVPTCYDNGSLVISHPPTWDTVFYAYFPPYDAARLQSLLDLCRADDCLSVDLLCSTGSGPDVSLVRTSSSLADPVNIWILCRQHPGEVQASWWAEGFLQALLDVGNRGADQLLGRARLWIVPNMNPDGSERGHHRTNGLGVNLNACWNASSADQSPPVFHVLRQMDLEGVDFSLDIHADEELPYVFAARVDTLKPISPKLAEVRRCFEIALAAAEKDFQIDGGYIRSHTTADPLSFCSPLIMNRYGAPAITLELPFKEIPNADAARSSRRDFGPDEAARIGRSCLGALKEILPMIERLRDLRAHRVTC